MTQRLIDEGIGLSVGAVRPPPRTRRTTAGSFKSELIRRQGRWRDADHIEVQRMQWIHWFSPSVRTST
jgi:putative transposase